MNNLLEKGLSKLENGDTLRVSVTKHLGQNLDGTTTELIVYALINPDKGEMPLIFSYTVEEFEKAKTE